MVGGEEEAGGEDEATGSSAEVDLSFPLDNHASPRHWAEGMDMYIVIGLTLHNCLLGSAARHIALSYAHRSSILSKGTLIESR